MSEEPLSKSLDLEAWEPSRPREGFAQEVTARATAARPRTLNKPRIVGGVAISLALAAGVLLFLRAPAHGEVTADTRQEVTVGHRATLVLEPGAKVKWTGDDVTQEQGEVFYRVDRGGRFVVHAPGKVDVQVKGTCFRIKATEESMKKRELGAGIGGAVLATAVLVSVYEGKVIASQGKDEVTLTAGESAKTSEEGLRRGDSDKGAGGLGSGGSAGGEADRAFEHANGSLAEQVREYRRRLLTIEGEKQALATRLDETEEKLKKSGAGKVPEKNEFDLSKDDWAELAKNGTIKIATPCNASKYWEPTPEKLDKMGLQPTDGPIIKEAFRSTNEWMKTRIRATCVQVIGKEDIVDKLGPADCTKLALDIMQATGDEGLEEARYQIGEIQAGLRPPPKEGEKVHPLLSMMLPLAQGQSIFEGKLAEHFGPEEAHRLAFADEMCRSRSTWGGPGPRKKP